jgi:glycine betaine/proline transport system ATP-binding protein
MNDEKPDNGVAKIVVNEEDSNDNDLCEILRSNAECAVVKDSSGTEVGYLNKKDIAEVVKPLVED